MKTTIKSVLTAFFAVAALTAVSLSAQAQPTEKQKEIQALPQQCEKLFKETENLIAEAEKQPGTHTQLRKIKSKLNQSKQQILEMELATQIRSCDIGLAKLTSKQQ
ncbi:DUF5339 domain-containing protein [Necropsobacter massiliensis]|uniref:DUF5339 domain-containing protein n=1 Tax=Necropsobacter massiliensis TaxID=1400001 RepID=UPI000595D942|nr:DUF5339 domain-containing protein [Necropsobacter massiliensis]